MCTQNFNGYKVLIIRTHSPHLMFLNNTSTDVKVSRKIPQQDIEIKYGEHSYMKKQKNRAQSFFSYTCNFYSSRKSYSIGFATKN